MREPMRPFVFGLNDEDLIIYNPKSISGGTRDGRGEWVLEIQVSDWGGLGGGGGIEYKTLWSTMRRIALESDIWLIRLSSSLYCFHSQFSDIYPAVLCWTTVWINWQPLSRLESTWWLWEKDWQCSGQFCTKYTRPEFQSLDSEPLQTDSGSYCLKIVDFNLRRAITVRN